METYQLLLPGWKKFMNHFLRSDFNVVVRVLWPEPWLPEESIRLGLKLETPNSKKKRMHGLGTERHREAASRGRG